MGKSTDTCNPIGCEVPSQGLEGSLSSSLEEELKNITGFEETKKTKLKSPDKFRWDNQPYLKGQFQNREMWEYDQVKVKLFDLTKAKDLEQYSAIIEDSFVEDPRIVVLDEQKQFCQNSENWKILIQFAKIKYKKFTDEEGN